MRSRSLAHDHDAAVARRLELLTSELAAVRDDSTGRAGSWAPPGPPRIRAVPDLASDVEPSWREATAGASEVRMPGRHASRRTTGRVAGRGGAGPVPWRVGLGPGQLAVVAVVAVVGLVATCWFLVRSGGHEVAAPLAVHTPGRALASPEGSTATSRWPR